jgi:hypothetical protein
MRIALAVALALAAAPAATAEAPMTHLLASAHGLRSVEIGTDSAKLSGRVWVYREGGTGTAQGRADVRCHTKPTAAGTGWMDQSFNFAIARGGRQEVWQRTGNETCMISVSLQGRGELRFTLRGY